MPLLDELLGSIRSWQIKGKGTVLNPLVPHEGVHTVSVWGKYRMTLDLRNAIHRQIFMGCFAREMTRWTRALLPVGGTFLDVGAHAGYFVLLAAHRIGRNGSVFAFEPNPPVFAMLNEHLTINRIAAADAYNIALADAVGTLRLYIPPASESRDYNVTSVPHPGWTPVDVPCERLDDHLDRLGIERVDVMKVDTEGAEPVVFAGGARHLAAGTVRHIVVEVNGPRLVESGSSPERLVTQLGDLGFSPARLVGNRAISVGVASMDLHPEHEHDCLFVHRTAAPG